MPCYFTKGNEDFQIAALILVEKAGLSTQKGLLFLSSVLDFSRMMPGMAWPGAIARHPPPPMLTVQTGFLLWSQRSLSNVLCKAATCIWGHWADVIVNMAAKQ